MPPSGRLFIISGPSGAGKSTVVRRVLDRAAGALDAMCSVSVTTRSPRAGETDGREYRFVDQAEFDRLRDRGELIEFARVHDQWYGTPAAPVQEALASGRCVVLEIDVQGGIQAHRRFPDAMGIFLVAPSAQELRRRIMGRGTEDPQVIERRLEAAAAELGAARQSGVYRKFLVNDNLDDCVGQVEEILLEGTRK